MRLNILPSALHLASSLRGAWQSLHSKFLSFLMGALCVGCNAQNPNVIVLSPTDFKAAVEKDRNAILLDVRRPAEYADGHLKGARLMNWMDDAAFKKEAATLDKTKTVYVYCRSGRRSNSAANYLAAEGFKVIDMKGGILAWTSAALPTTTFSIDTFVTENGRQVAITFIKHGTLLIEIDGYAIHIDPVLMFGTDYSKLPKADAVLVTHEHKDHYDKAAIAKIRKSATVLVSNGRVGEMPEQAAWQNKRVMKVGDKGSLADGTVALTATAAYNITPGHENFHPKGRDIGFLLDIDNLRIYIAGDTEDIPELAQLKDVDIAFLPVNQPYTMTAAQCINAISLFRPKVVYPYHYGETDLTPIVEKFSGSKDVEVRVRELQ